MSKPVTQGQLLWTAFCLWVLVTFGAFLAFCKNKEQDAKIKAIKAIEAQLAQTK